MVTASGHFRFLIRTLPADIGVAMPRGTCALFSRCRDISREARCCLMSESYGVSSGLLHRFANVSCGRLISTP